MLQRVQCKCLLKHKSKLKVFKGCVCVCVSEWTLWPPVCHSFTTAWQCCCCWQHRCRNDKMNFCNFRHFSSTDAFCVGYSLSTLSHTILSCWRSAALLLWVKTISIHFVYWICQCRSNLYFFTYNVLHLHRCGKILNSITLFLCKFSGFSIRKGWWKPKKLKRNDPILKCFYALFRWFFTYAKRVKCASRDENTFTK